MPRQKIEERNTRKLYKTKRGSVTVTLPIEMIRDLKWRDGQKVTFRQSGSKIIIEDWER